MRVCEESNDVAISKLKIIMNKCQTLYFVCKNCDKMLRDTPEGIHDKLLGKIKSLETKLVEKCAAVAKHIETKYVKDLKDSYVQTNNGTYDQLNMHFFMHFCPGAITTHAESINSDLQRGLDRRLRHIQH